MVRCLGSAEVLGGRIFPAIRVAGGVGQGFGASPKERGHVIGQPGHRRLGDGLVPLDPPGLSPADHDCRSYKHSQDVFLHFIDPLIYG
jgi:hypothetical protein